ncbi:MAG: aspartate carbamoyltransferase catalytic subunit [Elusimicrobia bacterium]|nr:aspartate carbamoyltransferase catalytic subunit [Elusimicrobiota bacterium]
MIGTHKDLLGIETLKAEEIHEVLDEAKRMPKQDSLSGKTVALLFFEPSTRTKTSFELAAKRLGAEVINIQVSLSSVQKGESLLDTLKTLEAMGVDLFVIRHAEPGILNPIASEIKASLVNAGDGAHEHPTQALLDFYTIRERKKRFKGLKVVIVGDILHSRVARSDVWGLHKLGALVTLCGPATLIPKEAQGWDVEISYNLEKALHGADVINVLRLQLERQKQSFVPSLEEYSRLYGLDVKRLSLAQSNCVVMHPGPMNRGVEIFSEVADGPRSIILEQVANGVRIRMAVLRLLLGESQPEKTREKRCLNKNF